MNKIIAPITKCGNAGIDQYGQLVVYSTSLGGSRISQIIRDPRGKTCPICGKGWELTVDGLQDQHSFTLLTQQLAHYRCMTGYYSMQERAFVDSVLCDDRWNRGGLGIEVDEIPNEYGASWNTPWFRIRFTKALPGVDMVIGRRKRVWQIGVNNLLQERIDDLVLTFAAANVQDTTGHDGLNWFVHAWTKEEVMERVGMIMNVLLPKAHRVVPADGEGTHAAGSDKRN